MAQLKDTVIQGELRVTDQLSTASMNQTPLIGTGEAGGDKGSSANPRYFPARWKFNTNINLVDGTIVTFKIPIAGHDYGTFLSLDNGTTYKPIVYSSTARLTTHFGVNCIVTAQYDSSGSAASMFAVAGQNNTTRVTVSGGVWRMLTLYDSGNSNDTSVMYIRAANATYKPTTNYQRYVLALLKNSTQVIPLNTDKTSSNNNGTTGNTHVLTTEEFDISSQIFVYNANDASYTSANTIALGQLWYAHAGIDLRYSFNLTTSTLTAHKDVYVKAVLQSATTATLCTDGNPITQTLPSTDDGYIYILLGRAYSGYQMAFVFFHPIYYYKNGQLRRYNCDPPVSSLPEVTSSDNGKILMVVNGEWSAETINDATGVGF